jgi:hypothetical protein
MAGLANTVGIESTVAHVPPTAAIHRAVPSGANAWSFTSREPEAVKK